MYYIGPAIYIYFIFLNDFAIFIIYKGPSLNTFIKHIFLYYIPKRILLMCIFFKF